MNRRTFNKTLSLGVAGLSIGIGKASSLPGSEIAASGASISTAPVSKWPYAYRRLLVDTHVPDWDPMLLSKFDARKYVETIAKSDFDAVMQYANSHVGLCLWPSKVGKQHNALKGRDFFGDVLNECRKHNLHTIAYFSLIYDIWAWDAHADWRTMPHGEKFNNRTRTVCPNSSGYRDYLEKCLTELTTKYEFESIFLDMTFWPTICYCNSCQERYKKEHNSEIPRVLNWEDPNWRLFQKTREAWILEFAYFATYIIKSVRPNTTVNHQYSPIFSSWKRGMPTDLSKACDYVGGDFYGGPSQLSLACKVFDGLSRIKPFEFHTSRTIGLGDFESIKPESEMKSSAAIATIHSAAKLFIDTLKPDGTLNENAYEYMAKANRFTIPYEPYLGGDMLADVAIYFDKESLYDPDEKQISTNASISNRMPHLDAVVANARILSENHIPYGVITNINLDRLKNYRAVMVSSVFEMTLEQAAKFREFVNNGGILFISGVSSLNMLIAGGPKFLLDDVIGVKFDGWLGTKWSYLTPKDEQIAKTIWPQENITYDGKMVKALTSGTNDILATVTLPFVNPDAGNETAGHFAQIWSNPPAPEAGTNPGIVVNSFGKGKSVWLAATIESRNLIKHKELMLHLIKRYLPDPMYFEAETLPSVEMTLFDQPGKKRMLAGFASLQDQKNSGQVLSKIRIKKPTGKSISSVKKLPGEASLNFTDKGVFIEFTLEPFDTLAMALINYI
jgi:hypothetical protein